jgi:hypothetical protein
MDEASGDGLAGWCPGKGGRVFHRDGM